VIVLLFGDAQCRAPPGVPPTYRVHLVAAPRAGPGIAQGTRGGRSSRGGETSADFRGSQNGHKNLRLRAATPPANRDQTQREAAPRTTSQNQPLPGEKPSTGNDVATVSTEGVRCFPFPEYLQNIVSQVLRQWPRPAQSTPLEAEVRSLSIVTGR